MAATTNHIPNLYICECVNLIYLLFTNIPQIDNLKIDRDELIIIFFSQFFWKFLIFLFLTDLDLIFFGCRIGIFNI
jgi:hypothetical protein